LELVLMGLVGRQTIISFRVRDVNFIEHKTTPFPSLMTGSSIRGCRNCASSKVVIINIKYICIYYLFFFIGEERSFGQDIIL
jgi:hypothetical protein